MMNETIKKIVEEGQKVFEMACMSLHCKDVRKGSFIEKKENGTTLIY